MTPRPGLSTYRDRRSDEKVAHEAVDVYREWDTAMSMRRDRYARRVKNVDLLVIKNFVSNVSTFFMDDSGTWVIHEERLQQM